MECRVFWLATLLICLTTVSGCQRSEMSSPPAEGSTARTSATGAAHPQTPAGEPEPSQVGLTDEWHADGSREWKYIVIHHTATQRGNVESIHETHLTRKDNYGNPWMGIGYHFVIGNGHGMEDGAIEPTFRWREQLHGAHAGNNEYNQHGIGVVLVGNFEENPPSLEQLDAVKRLVGFLSSEFDIPADHIVGHDEVKITACPGRLFPLAEVRQSTSVSTADRSRRTTTGQIAGVHTTDIRE